MRETPPKNVKEKPVSSDTELSAEEKETNLTCPNDLETCRITSEVPTIIKWVFSIDESSVDWVRTDDNGEIVACSATIPKGIVKLQGSARKSDTHSQMVSYGPNYGGSE